MEQESFYEVNIPAEGLSDENILVYSVAAAERLGWYIEQVTYKHILLNASARRENREHLIYIEIDGNYSLIRTRNDQPSNIENASRFEKAFTLAKEELLSGEYQDLLSRTIHRIDHHNEKEKETGFLDLLKPSGNYLITPVLLYINTAIFILMVISGVHIFAPSTSDLIDWGANFKPLTLEGEAWRLLTSCFLHIGIVHLLFNMYALIQIGSILEPLLGKARFLAAYLITGIAASIVSTWWHTNTVSAGASGALFGMFGFYIALLTTNLMEKEERKRALTSMGVFLVYNLAIGMHAGVDNAAHIGGLISGFVIAYAFYPSLKNPQRFSPNIYCCNYNCGCRYNDSRILQPAQ